MTKSLDPFRFLLMAVSGWMNQRQMELIDYLREENRVLREQWGERRLRFNDDQRRRLAVRAKGLGSKVLREMVTIVTAETLLAWHRRLMAGVASSGTTVHGTPWILVKGRTDSQAVGLMVDDRARIGRFIDNPKWIHLHIGSGCTHPL